MKVELLTPEREPEYTEYLAAHDDSLFNASLIFRDFIRLMSPDSQPFYYVVLDNDKIVGAMPAFMKKGPLGPVLNSMPWFGSNPGVTADNAEAGILLLQAFSSTARWTNCFSSTFISPPFCDQWLYEKAFEEEDVFIDTRISMMTKLPVFKSGEQFSTDLLKLVHQKTRNQIVKSINGCQVYETYTDDDWQFLKDQHRLGMEAVGGPVKEQEFDIIRKHFRKRIDYKLYVAFTRDGNADRVAALLLEYHGKTVEYITPVTVAESRHLCAMNLLIFSAMGDAAQVGYKWWNWGGTKLPGQQGTYHFKKRFGAEEGEYKYYTKIYLDCPRKITPKELVNNYPYFYVMPYALLER